MAQLPAPLSRTLRRAPWSLAPLLVASVAYADDPMPTPDEIDASRGEAVAPAPLAPRPSPYCPTCRVATLWHAKRAAWWCSTCKRTL